MDIKKEQVTKSQQKKSPPNRQTLWELDSL